LGVGVLILLPEPCSIMLFMAYMRMSADQRAIRYRQPAHPETFSFEGTLNAGFDFNFRTTALEPLLRLNDGPFTFEMEYLSTQIFLVFRCF
jgi:hypothetical protein